MSSENQNNETVLKVTLKALRDASYKKRLIANPVEAIKELYPEFNAETEIIVQDQTAPKKVYINVSPAMASLLYETSDDLELCEEDLEMVSGGADSLSKEADEGWFNFGNCFC